MKVLMYHHQCTDTKFNQEKPKMMMMMMMEFQKRERVCVCARVRACVCHSFQDTLASIYEHFEITVVSNCNSDNTNTPQRITRYKNHSRRHS
jgi:hypothetical protein